MLPKSPVPTFTWDSNNLKYVALAGRSRKLTFCLKQIYLTLTLCFLKAWLPTLEAKTSWPLKASKTWTAAAWTWATFRLSLSMGAEIGSRFSLFAWQNIANEAQKLKPWSWSLIYLWFLWFSLPSCLHLSSRSSLKRFSAFLSTPCHWQLCPWAASCRQGWPGIWSGCIATKVVACYGAYHLHYLPSLKGLTFYFAAKLCGL